METIAAEKIKISPPRPEYECPENVRASQSAAFDKFFMRGTMANVGSKLRWTVTQLNEIRKITGSKPNTPFTEEELKLLEYFTFVGLHGKSVWSESFPGRKFGQMRMLQFEFVEEISRKYIYDSSTKQINLPFLELLHKRLNFSHYTIVHHRKMFAC